MKARPILSDEADEYFKVSAKLLNIWQAIFITSCNLYTTLTGMHIKDVRELSERGKDFNLLLKDICSISLPDGYSEHEPTLRAICESINNLRRPLTKSLLMRHSLAHGFWGKVNNEDGIVFIDMTGQWGKPEAKSAGIKAGTKTIRLPKLRRWTLEYLQSEVNNWTHYLNELYGAIRSSAPIAKVTAYVHGTECSASTVATILDERVAFLSVGEGDGLTVFTQNKAPYEPSLEPKGVNRKDRYKAPTVRDLVRHQKRGI